MTVRSDLPSHAALLALEHARVAVREACRTTQQDPAVLRAMTSLHQTRVAILRLAHENTRLRQQVAALHERIDDGHSAQLGRRG